MRIKNFTFLFLLGMLGLFSIHAQAQQDATIDPSEIRFWIGEGESQAILAVNWDEPDTCLAWGFRFSNETAITVKEMMVAIAEADYRFSFDAPASFVNDIMYKDDVLDLSLTEYGYMMYNVNGVPSMEYYDTQVVVDGDFVKWGDTNCATVIDPENYVLVWESPVVPVYPLASEAMIDPSEILYWVGNGDHEVVFAVNWNNPDTCLAWGYRFNEETILVQDVMDAIAAADGRFAYIGGGGWLTDITFDDANIHLALEGLYWMYNINGVGAGLGFDQQPVVDGDFIKWGDESCGTEIAQWTYVWETPVTPVSTYSALDENTSFAAIYPNPASSFAMINASCLNAVVTVSVADLQGRVLECFTATTTEPIRLETAEYESGIYFVTVNDGVNNQTTKLVVR